MTFFQFLDNRYRNLALDSQLEFSLQKDGEQKAAHLWVRGIRKLWTAFHFVILPFVYVFKRIHVLSPDVNNETRIEELKAYTEKVLRAAKDAQTKGEPLPADPSELVKPESVKQSTH